MVLPFRFVFKLMVIYLLVPTRIHGEQISQVSGKYVVTQYSAGKPLPNTQTIEFTVSLGENKWKIGATNLESQDWETLMFDGTNTYDLMPLGRHFTLSEMDTNIFGAPDGKTPFYGTVVSGNHYLPTSASFVHIYLPWIAYCLPPQSVDLAWPLPATMYADFLAPYGYRWKMESLNNRFIKSIGFIRDSSLDLSYKEEFLRPLFRYPPTVEIYENVERGLDLRKKTPDGYVVGTYTCQKSVEVGNQVIPEVASLTRKVTYDKAIYTVWGLDMHTASIVITNDTIDCPPLLGNTFIRDYRYYMRTNSKTFPFANYSTAGVWKSNNDSELLAEREHYIKHGPNNRDYGIGSSIFSLQRKGRIILIWSFFAITSLAAMTILVSAKKSTTMKE
jgi:hypothetical protein